MGQLALHFNADSVPRYHFEEILRALRDTSFRELSGSTVSARIPASERLLNEVVASSLPRNGHVREVHLEPLAADAFSVRLSPHATFLPSITLRLQIDRQPELPADAVLGLRLTTMGALLGIAGAAFPLGKLLPPGVRLEGDRILVDLRALADRHGAGEYLNYVTRLRVNTEAARVVLTVEIRVP